ncbi:MAG: rod-binding protein [Spirochaetaceae bacterium]|jgi:flagellar protein FlgJ|nr:rod-binding protein [Spirochaetaceae bacterium]
MVDISSIGSMYNEYNSVPQMQMDLLLRKTEENKAGGKLNFAELLDNAALVDKQGTKTAQIDKGSELFKQCEALETFLLKNLLKGMRSTVQKSGLLDTGFAGEMYEDMLWDQYAEKFSANTNFGLAEQAYLELSGQRGVSIQA